MSDANWQKQQQDEYEQWLDLMESEAAIIREEHPSMEELLGKLEYEEER